jgi:4'-phosphopantetheinyl transferase
VNRPAINEAHLWWAFPNQICDPELLQRQFLALSDSEQERQRRFVFERHRRQYLVSHALIRDVLSRYAPVAPEEWRFQTNAYGRPSIAEPAEWRGLRFNLSHTDGRAVVAVAWEVDVGVDVEATRALDDLSEIADRFFSPMEVAQLRKSPDWFYDFWTLKEAYIKARGLGLAIPLDTFSFILSDAERPAIVFHEGCQDQAERWQFVLQRGEGYRMGLAAAAGADHRIRVIEREVIPLGNVLG